MPWVATRQDLTTYGGLPASALVPDARQVGSFIGSTIELCGHGFDLTPIRFSAASGATLDTALDPLVWYTAVSNGDPDFFTLLNGSTPAVLVGNAVGAIMVLEDVTPKIAAILRARTSYVVARAKAYAAPWTTPPEWGPMIVAQLAAPDVAEMLRISSSRFDVERVTARAAAAEKFCEMLDEGVPMGDGVGPVDPTPQRAENGAVLCPPKPGPFGPPVHPRGLYTGPLGITLGRDKDRV